MIGPAAVPLSWFDGALAPRARRSTGLLLVERLRHLLDQLPAAPRFPDDRPRERLATSWEFARIARGEDDAQPGLLPLHAPGELEAVHPRHTDVGEEDVYVGRRDELQGMVAVGGFQHAIARHRQEVGRQQTHVGI